MAELKRNYSRENILRVRGLRGSMGCAEKRLWYDGLARKRLGFAFRRQYPLGPYVLDFYCAEARVCVEVDGDQHEFTVEKDARRDAWLAESGILTLRFAADSVMLDLPHILWNIEEACNGRTSTLPLHLGRAGAHPSADPPFGKGEAS